MAAYLGNIFSPHQTGFPNDINAQHCLISIIKKLKKATKIGKKLSIVEITLRYTEIYLNRLIIPHDLIIVKFNAYCFGMYSLNFI